MAVLSLGEILKLKDLIKPYGYTIHLHDACGGQSFSIEPIGGNLSDKVYGVIETFFIDRKMSVEFFGEDKLNFAAR